MDEMQKRFEAMVAQPDWTWYNLDGPTFNPKRRWSMAKELHCGEIMSGCPEVIRGQDEEEVLKKGAQHARDAHGIEHLDDDTIRTVKSKIRDA